jgi:hypothetical protein
MTAREFAIQQALKQRSEKHALFRKVSKDRFGWRTYRPNYVNKTFCNKNPRGVRD